MEEVAFAVSTDIELSDYSLLPRNHQTSNAPNVTNEASGTMEQLQHSIIDIVTDPSTSNDMTENGGSGSSAENPSAGSVIEGIARSVALFLSLFFPQRVNNTAAAVGDTTTVGGSGSSRVWTWLRRKVYAIWLLLVIREMNPLKTGSFALGLVSFFVDKHLLHEDKTYLEVALWCGVFAFLIAPWSVPNVNAPRLAQARQGTAMLALIVGVLIALVTALDKKKFRWLVLLFFAIFFLFCLCVEEEEEGGSEEYNC